MASLFLSVVLSLPPSLCQASGVWLFVFASYLYIFIVLEVL